MADVTKCLNIECPIRRKCYRFTSEGNEYRQSYARFEPYVYHDDQNNPAYGCHDFIEDRGNDY